MEIENFNSKALLKRLTTCFSAEELESLARNSKFIQRKTSRLSGLSFLFMNVFDSSDGKERSLNDCCDWLEEEFGIGMTKQSLDERYNSDAVSFMRQCFMHVMETLNGVAVEQFSTLSFSRIQLTDSTSFKIPSHLSTFYVGTKRGLEAMIKMHFNYNLLNGQVADLAITDGVANDNLYKFGKSEEIQENGLYIRDLGYFSSAYFNKLDENKAYYISRAKNNLTHSPEGAGRGSPQKAPQIRANQQEA